MINNKKKIYFFGIGESNNSAIDARNKFVRIGLNTMAASDTHMQLMEASLMTPDDLAIGFSLSA
ncbi:MAG: SIS domain-containing protein [Clostridia bacterium]|nr:SIS domain-containing protein [Clostridia bacterium]